jgi:Subtilase family
MSWGFNESSGETAFDPTFRTPAGHQGITFVASSGDDGTAAGPEYPSSSPNVLAVGGTTLLVNEVGDYFGEMAWSGSGGGYSPVEPEPSYQRSVQKTGHRSTPDVAFDADPNTGVEVYQTPLGSSTGTWLTVGGTSLGSPSWAAIIAIVDQGRALQGKPSLDGPTQTLPALYSLPATDFNTVALPPPYSPWGGGVNPIGSPPSGGDFLRHQSKRTAGSAARANIATGRGSPVGPLLINGLVASDVTLPTSRSASRAAARAHISVRSSDHAEHRAPSDHHRRPPAQ